MPKKVSLKKLLLPRSESSSSSFTDLEAGSFNKKTRFKTVQIVQNTRASIKRPEYRVVKIAKENAISYEEFLDILQKPSVFIIKWSSNNTGCCHNRLQKSCNFEITSISGSILLKGKSNADDSIRVFDNKNKLFMMLNYTNQEKVSTDRDRGEATLSVPNSSIPLAKLVKLPSYIPYNKRFQMVSEHFPELNCNVEHQSLPSRRGGALNKYTITSGRKILSKLLQPATGEQVYVLVDENISVFQKTGILAAAIYISQKPMKNASRIICISIVFFLVFLLGFVVVACTVLDLRYKDNDGPKFPHKLKSGENT